MEWGHSKNSRAITLLLDRLVWRTIHGGEQIIRICGFGGGNRSRTDSQVRPGRIFEVTPAKDIVWEYINPFLGESGAGVGGTTSGLANSVFRAHRYGPDHPAIQGKDLDPDRHANLNRLYSPA